MGQDTSDLHSSSDSVSLKFPTKLFRPRYKSGRSTDDETLSYRKIKAKSAVVSSIEDSFWTISTTDDHLIPAACSASFIPPMHTTDSNRSLSSVSSTSTSSLSRSDSRRESISMLTGLFKQQLQTVVSQSKDFTTDYLGLFDIAFLSQSLRCFHDRCFGSRVSVESQSRFLNATKSEIKKQGYMSAKCPSVSGWKRFLSQLVTLLADATGADDDSDGSKSEIARLESRNQAVQCIVKHIQKQWGIGDPNGIMQWQCAFSVACEMTFGRRFSVSMQYAWDCLISSAHSMSQSEVYAKHACFGGGMTDHCIALADVRDDLIRGSRSTHDFITLIESRSPALLYLSRWLRLCHFPESARLVRFFHVYRRLHNDDARRVELFGAVAEHVAKDSECYDIAELPSICHECFAVAMVEYEEMSVLPLATGGVTSVDLCACMAGVFGVIEKCDGMDDVTIFSDERLTSDFHDQSSKSKGHFLISKLVQQLGKQLK